MRIDGDTVTFEAGDDVDPAFAGRTFVKKPNNSIPCVFARSEGTCAKVYRGAKCQHATYVWAEVASEANPALKQCDCCRFFTTTLTDVICGDGVVEKWCSECFEGRAKPCAKCGKVHLVSLLRNVAGTAENELWCNTCIAAHAESCAACGGVALRGSITHEIVTRADGRKSKVCSRCAASAVECPVCHVKILPTLVATIDGERYCPTCATAAGVARCSHCSCYTRQPAGPGGRVYCTDCRARGYGSAIHGYHGWGRNPVFVSTNSSGEIIEKARALADTLYLGFELESGGATSGKCAAAAAAVNALDPSENRFHLERDGSIPEYGFELISAPFTLQAHQAYDWKAALAVLVKNGLRSHDLDGRCGLHVHVSRAFLQPEDCAKIDLFVMKNQTFWERVARRTSGQYTRYVQKTLATAGQVTGEAGRYAAVNFTNERTIEFRMFRGSLRIETLMGVLGIVDALCHWVKTKTTEGIASNRGVLHEFVAWLDKDEHAGLYKDASEYVKRRQADVLDGEV